MPIKKCQSRTQESHEEEELVRIVSIAHFSPKRDAVNATLLLIAVGGRTHRGTRRRAAYAELRQTHCASPSWMLPHGLRQYVIPSVSTLLSRSLFANCASPIMTVVSH